MRASDSVCRETLRAARTRELTVLEHEDQPAVGAGERHRLVQENLQQRVGVLGPEQRGAEVDEAAENGRGIGWLSGARRRRPVSEKVSSVWPTRRRRPSVQHTAASRRLPSTEKGASTAPARQESPSRSTVKACSGTAGSSSAHVVVRVAADAGDALHQRKRAPHAIRTEDEKGGHGRRPALETHPQPEPDAAVRGGRSAPPAGHLGRAGADRRRRGGSVSTWVVHHLRLVVQERVQHPRHVDGVEADAAGHLHHAPRLRLARP